MKKTIPSFFIILLLLAACESRSKNAKDISPGAGGYDTVDNLIHAPDRNSGLKNSDTNKKPYDMDTMR